MFLGQWGLCEGAEVPFLTYIGLKCLSRPDIKPYRPKNLNILKIPALKGTEPVSNASNPFRLRIWRYPEGLELTHLRGLVRKGVFRSF